MQLSSIFEIVKEKALEDDIFRDKIIFAYEGEKPIVDFCRVCVEAGIEVYPMDIADADESEYAAMRRSTNGGGENSPHLGWEGNVFAAFIEEIRRL